MMDQLFSIGIEFDYDGNLYICDTINSRILKVTR